MQYLAPALEFLASRIPLEPTDLQKGGNMKRIVLASGLLLYATIASPGYSLHNTVSGIHVMPGGQVLFSTDGPHINPPPCGTVYGRFAFDSTTPTGKSMLGTLLTAYATKAKVYVGGLNACNVWGDSETVSYLVLI